MFLFATCVFCLFKVGGVFVVCCLTIKTKTSVCYVGARKEYKAR